MPRTEKVLTIFLASPGDVQEERLRLKDVVESWNTAWSRELSVRLELLRWETDAYPDAGEDAQDIINKQIPDDWDIFVGVMWCRFGTPTARAGSGTEEEFIRAVNRRRTSQTKVALLLYFKDEPIAPSRIDPSQLACLQKFQSETRAQGLLTWKFSDADEFEKLAVLHITKHVQEWRHTPVPLPVQDAETPSSTASALLEDTLPNLPVSSVQDAVVDDDGYLDLLEEFTLRSDEIQQVAERLNDAQTRLSAKTTEGHQELERLNSDPSVASVKKFRAAIALVADEMLAYTKLVDAEVPNFRQAIDKSMGALLKYLNIAADLYPDQLRDAKSAAFTLLKTLSESRQAVEGFRASTVSLPKMTKELNIAKRRQATALSALILEFEHGERLLSEGIAALSDLSASER